MAKASNNGRTASVLVGITIAMFCFGVFVLPPLYDVICDITGLNGKTGRVDAATPLVVDEDRWVTVEFLANVNRQLPWAFEPEVVRMKVNPGRIYSTNYLAHNPASRTMVGQAVPSVTPARAAIHFNKTECFCFTRQVFNAGESKQMPVNFIVGVDLPKDVDTITLSYTFFEAKPES